MGLPPGRRRWLSWWVVVALVGAAGVLFVRPVGAAAARADLDCTVAAGSEMAAVAAAAACGRPVVVGRSRSEYTQVLAQPDGRLTFESAVVPQRAKRPDGSWADLDLSLRAGRDGLLRPAVSVADVAFSAGGSGPLVTLTRSGKTLALSWPGTLRAPVVSGDSATYVDVLPEVDLVVRATPTGFTHVLVVKSAKAAADPAVRTMSLAVSGAGELVVRPDGSVLAVAGAVLVARAERAVMWDSSPRAGGALSIGQDPAAAESTAFAAGDGAKTAAVATRVDAAGRLVLVPDARLLDSGAVTFPVFVDPAWSVTENKWAYATNTGCTNSDHSVARVGLSPDGPCDGAVFRSFFHFPTNNGSVWLNGKYIYSAYVQTKLYHSWSCGPTPVNLYASSLIDHTMNATWSKTTLGSWLDVRSANAYKGSNCSGGSQPDAIVNFTGSNVKARVQTAADGNWATIAIGLSARDSDGTSESTQDRWKKFYPANTKLIVDYDSKPGTPTGLRLAGVACPGSGVMTTGTLSPTFSAVYPDADSGQTLTGTYEWIEVPAGGIGTVTATYPTRKPPPPPAPATAGGRGTPAAVSVVKSKTYAFRVRATDPAPYSRTSGWSAWCQFTPDTSVPPVTVTPVTLPPGPGKPGTFRIESTATDVTSFKYGWSAPTTVVSASGSNPKTATITVTAPKYGVNVLYVSAVDGTLNEGFGSTEFTVGRPTPAVAQWGLETYPGVDQAAALADRQPALPISGGDTPLTPSNMTWTGDVRLVGGQTATFNGTSSYLYTPAPVVDRTKSFAVAAWVKLGNVGDPLPTDNRSIVAQEGDTTSSFTLGYLNDGGRQKFAAWMHTVDANPTAAYAPAVAPTSPAMGVWTHVAGVYDAAAGTLTLYVNGQPVASSTIGAVQAWSTARRISVGREKHYSSATTKYWKGQIADVQVFDRALVDHDFTGQLASDPASGGVDEPGILDPVQVGEWTFAGGLPCFEPLVEPGVCEALESPGHFNRRLALSQGANFGVGHRDEALLLDGVYDMGDPFDPNNGMATQEYGWSQTNTAAPENPTWQNGPVLRTDQSFTVSAWVHLDRTDLYQAAVAQDGTVNSGFYLYYAPESGGLWKFKMLASATTPDNTGATYTVAAAPDATDSWHHLVGVLDAGRRQLRLYVDGEPAATSSMNPAWQPWNAGGPLTVGRSYGTSNLLWGGVDDLTVFQGAMTDAKVKTLYDEQVVDNP
jgi:hypothetical protein